MQMKYYPNEVYYEHRGGASYIVLVYGNSKVEHVISAQQNAHLTGGGLCAKCGSPSWAHGAIGHDFIPPHPQVA